MMEDLPINITLEWVLYYPDLTANLISILGLSDLEIITQFTKNHTNLFDANDIYFLTRIYIMKMYQLLEDSLFGTLSIGAKSGKIEIAIDI